MDAVLSGAASPAQIASLADDEDKLSVKTRERLQRELGELEGQTFVAMELVKGRTVRAWMDEEPRPGWKACVELFLQLGQGLAAAHKRGLVHRDFKPSNAILDEEGRARVLDFGLARHEEGQENDEPSVPNAAHTEVSATASLPATITRSSPPNASASRTSAHLYE